MKKSYPEHFFCGTRYIHNAVFSAAVILALVFNSLTANAQNTPGNTPKVPYDQSLGYKPSSIRATEPAPIKTSEKISPANSQGQAGGVTHLEKKWKANPFENKVFIENRGQFNSDLKADKKVLFYAVVGKDKMYFTPEGVVYRHDDFVPKGDGEEEKDKESDVVTAKAKDKDKMVVVQPHYLAATWQNASPTVTIDAGEEQMNYYTYRAGKNGTIKANAFKKITYRNIYPGIDLEYTFPKDKDGIKYSVIVHPGADVSQLKLKYDGVEDLHIDENGNVIEHADSLNDITDHTPVSFYEDGGDVNVKYMVNGRTESFAVNGDYDKTRTLVIDPWSTAVSFAGGYQNAYDVDWDNAGNVYVYGGYNPFQLVKLNSSGTIIWTYTTSWPVGTTVYGCFATDRITQECYLGEGVNNLTGATAVKISPAGFYVTGWPGSNTMREMWRMTYNPCNFKIIIGGGGTNTTSSQVALLDTNMSAIVPQDPLGVGVCCYDVDRLCMDPSGSNVFFDISSVDDGVHFANWDNIVMSCPVANLAVNNYAYGPTGDAFEEGLSVEFVGSGIASGGQSNAMNGMAASKNWLYNYDGYNLTRVNKGSGTASTAISISPYYSNVEGYGETDVYWGGLAADACDNVYVGNVDEGSNTGQLLVYNSSLTLLSNTGLPNYPYDVKLGLNDAVIYTCGFGFVEAFTNTISTVATGVVPTPTTCGLNNGSATANLTLCGSAPSGITYLWEPGGQNTQTATGLAAGTYTVSMSIGCGVTYQAVTTIGGSSPLTAPSLGSNSPICAGQTLNLTSSSAGATGYLWVGPNSFSSGAQNPSIAGATTAASGTYTCTASAAGCTSAPSTISVTVNSGPPAPSLGSNSPICAGSTLNLTASSAGATSYTWTGPNAFASGAQNPSIAGATTAASGTYTCTATSAGGCVSTISTVVVTVNAIPAAPAVGSNSPICAGQTLNLTANTAGATGYSWTGPNLFASGLQNPSIAGATTAASGTYTVVATKAGCTSAQSTISVVVNPIPAAPSTGSNSPICAGQTLNLTSSSAGATGYSWTGP
ncbi:MAG TPA: hypothetical protein VK890_08895, partial [Bacteroidia bacterium]|nr:hypothetical protein [Bacteroidia bacterium]